MCFIFLIDQSASPVQREADSTEARQVSEYMKKIKSFFIEHRTRSELQSLKRRRMSSSSDDDADDNDADDDEDDEDEDEEYFKQRAERRKKHKAYPPGQVKPRRIMTARSTMPVVVTKVDDRPLPSRSNH